jgi:hypothetical protein
VLRANAPAKPRFVSDIDKELRATLDEFPGHVGKDGLPANRSAEAESGALENSELLSRQGRSNLGHVNPGPGMVSL